MPSTASSKQTHTHTKKQQQKVQRKQIRALSLVLSQNIEMGQLCQLG